MEKKSEKETGSASRSASERVLRKIHKKAAGLLLRIVGNHRSVAGNAGDGSVSTDLAGIACAL